MTPLAKITFMRSLNYRATSSYSQIWAYALPISCVPRGNHPHLAGFNLNSGIRPWFSRVKVEFQAIRSFPLFSTRFMCRLSKFKSKYDEQHSHRKIPGRGRLPPTKGAGDPARG